MRTWKDRAIDVAAILLVLLLAGWAWNFTHQPPAPTKEAVVATPAPQVAAVPRVDVTPKAPVKAYAPAAKAKLSLPKAVADDDNQYALTASRIEASDHPMTVSTVINAQTGEATAYVHEEPLPWMAWDTHGDAGIYVGVKSTGERAARFELRQGLVQIKAVHIGVTASADQPIGGPLKAEGYLGVGVWYRW